MGTRIRSCFVTALTLLLLATPALADSGSSLNDPRQWRAGLPTEGSTMHKEVYPGIDLIYSGNQNRVTARFIVHPKAELGVLHLRMDNMENVQIGRVASALDRGIQTVITLLEPSVFQTVADTRVGLLAGYEQRKDGAIGIAVQSYDRTRPLVISIVATFTPASGSPKFKDPPGLLSALPDITATMTDQVIPDIDNDGKAVPGETIKYTVVIGNSGVDATGVDFDDTIDPNTTLTPGSIKSTPLAYSQSLTILEDNAQQIAMTGNDPDGGSLTFSINTPPTKGGLGSITQNPPSSADVTYTPNGNANDNTSPAGSDSFVFKVTDADNNQKTATVTVNLTPVNDAPTLTCGPDQTKNSTDVSPITVPGWATGITPGPATATDEAAQVVTINVTNNTNLALFSAGPSVNATTGTLSYTLSGVTGFATVTLQAQDNGGTLNSGVDVSAPCSFSVTVNGAPSAVADNYTTSPNTTISRTAADPDDLLDNDSRGFPAANLVLFGGGNLGGTVTDHTAGSTVSPLPTFSDGSLTVGSDGSFSFTPPTGFTGNYTFDYYITNVAGSSAATVTIAVQAMPVAVADNYFSNINTTLTRTAADPDDLLDNDNLGSPPATLTSFGGGSLGGTVTSNAAGATVALAGGTLTVNSDGGFSLTTPTVSGSFTFQYRLTNVSGTSDALVTIEVRQVPTAVADNYSTLVNTTLSRSASDPDDLLDNDTRGFPLATITSFGGGSLGGTVTTNAAGASVALAGGTLQVNSNGSFSLTTPTTTGSFAFDYRISNSSGTSDATVTIEVRKAPTAVTDNYTTQANTTVSRNTGDSDDLLDNDDRGFPLATIASFGGGSLGGTVTGHAAGTTVTPLPSFATGSLQVNADGSFSFTPPTGFTGDYTFNYRITNAAGTSDALVTISVAGPPTGNDDAAAANSVPGDAFHTALNTTLSSLADPNTPSLLSNDNLGFPAGTLTSFGGGSLGGTVLSNAAGSTATFGTGSLQVNTNGEFIFTPDNNFVGLFTFEYRLTNTAGFDDATVTIAVGVRPNTVTDTRTATGNVRLSTATNLLLNDIGDQLTVTASDATSVQGGNVSVSVNGSFTYNPPAGYEGSDSFNYTAGNGFGSGGSASVTITVSGMIWFINNTAAAGDGRLTSPFNTLAAFQAVNNGTGNNPAVGDNIFIYTGSGDYTGGVTLLGTQKLIGDGSSSTLAALTGITLATGSDALPVFSGTDPVIANSAASGNGINLASGNTVRGLTVGNTPNGFGYSGGAVSTFNIQEASKTGTGGALNISTSGAAGTVQFDNLSSTNAPGNGINLVSVTGTITVSAGTISNPTSTAVNVSGGNVSMTYPGSITQSNNASTVSVSNGHTGTLTFQTGTINTTNGNGLQFDNADGAYNFNGTTTLNGGDAGIDILAGSDATSGSTGTFTFGSGTSITRGNSVSGAAFNLSGSDANVTYNGSMTLGTSSGNMIAISDHDAGTMNFNTGNLTKGSSTTQGISIQNSNGGSINFNNPTISITMTTGNAVSLTGNTGGTINFATGSGGNGMDLITTTGIGFNATGGGTVNITGSGNTINSTSGATALNVNATTIGASDLNFQSISSSGGTATGIILDNTGSSGGLVVNGDGTNTAVGGNSSGGTIANKTGADGSTTTGVGIYLNNTRNVVLRRMTINGTNQNYGIRGFSVIGFTLEYATVNGTNGTAATLAAPENAGEGSIYFGNATSGATGLTGTGTVTNCIISGGRSRNMSVINSGGTLNRLTITGTTFGLNQSFIDATQSLAVIANRPASGTTTMNTTVTGSTFTGAPGDLVNFTGQEPTTTLGVSMDVIFQNNTCSNNHPNNNIGGGGMTIAGFGPTTFNVSNNSFRDANGSAITLQMGAPVGGSTVATSLSGTLNNNTIGVTGVVGSGSASGNGIFCSFADNTTAPKGVATIAITNNVIRRYNGNAGIYADNTGGNYDVNLTITGNTTAEPGVGAFAGLALAAGAPASANDIDVCASITGNDFSAGDPANASDIILGGGASGASSIRLPGLVPSGTEAARQAQVQSFLLANNNVAGTVVSAYVDAPATFASTFIGGAACTTP